MTRFAPTVTPPPLPKSSLGYRMPSMRAAELNGMISVKTNDLFPNTTPALLKHGDDPRIMRNATEKAFETVDLSMIQPNETVDILCSEHGFAMDGGHAYAEMLRTVKDIVERRTGNTKVRLAFSVGSDTTEGRDLAAEYDLVTYFDGRVHYFGPHDKGVAIQTEIGTLYGIGQAYKARRIIYCHYDDPREVHFHRVNGRALKAFTMSFARLETRAIFHNHFPTASANIVPRALYESEFIQNKWVCGVILRSSPNGITGVSAGKDLIAIDREISRDLLRDYSKQIHLFESIKDCVAIMDGHRWLHYQHAGGLTSCNLFFGPHDHLDLERDYRWTGNPAVKAVIMNYAWRFAFTLPMPFIGADPEITEQLQRQMSHMMIRAAENLPHAVEMAYELGNTRKAIIFDGTYGAINCSPEMAEHLFELRDKVNEEVDGGLMQKWLSQRGLDTGLAA